MKFKRKKIDWRSCCSKVDWKCLQCQKKGPHRPKARSFCEISQHAFGMTAIRCLFDKCHGWEIFNSKSTPYCIALQHFIKKCLQTTEMVSKWKMAYRMLLKPNQNWVLWGRIFSWTRLGSAWSRIVNSEKRPKNNFQGQNLPGLPVARGAGPAAFC